MYYIYIYVQGRCKNLEAIFDIRIYYVSHRCSRKLKIPYLKAYGIGFIKQYLQSVELE